MAVEQHQRLAVRALVAGLCLAALVAIVALLSGDFGDAEWKTVASSLAFSVASATFGVGDGLRLRAHRDPLGITVALVTMGASAAAFALLLVGMWAEVDDEGLWRACGLATLLALWGAHASLVLRGRRRADPTPVRTLVAVSLVTAGADTLVGSVAVLGVEIDVNEAAVRLLAASLVVMLLTTVLPPILRRLGDVPEPRVFDAFGRDAERAAAPPLSAARLADEVQAVADRLDGLDATPAVRREAQTLRALAARAERSGR